MTTTRYAVLASVLYCASACCEDVPACAPGFEETPTECSASTLASGTCVQMDLCCKTVFCKVKPPACCERRPECPFGFDAVEGIDAALCRLDVMLEVVTLSKSDSCRIVADVDGCCEDVVCRTESVAPMDNMRLHICDARRRCGNVLGMGGDVQSCHAHEVCLDDPSDSCNPDTDADCAGCCIVNECNATYCPDNQKCVLNALGSPVCLF